MYQMPQGRAANIPMTRLKVKSKAAVQRRVEKEV